LSNGVREEKSKARLYSEGLFPLTAGAP
jgi:hypothetical protein